MKTETMVIKSCLGCPFTRVDTDTFLRYCNRYDMYTDDVPWDEQPPFCTVTKITVEEDE